MIWIIGGTSEARELVEGIKDIDDFIVTVATESGKEFLDIKNIEIGRMNLDEMKGFIDKNNISLVLDMSHPYAKIVSENASLAALSKGIKYIRYSRKSSEISKGIYLDSYEEAFECLRNIKGTIFFTTGSKNIEDFEKLKGDNRHIYRVLPALESIEECKKNNVHLKDIIALLGPFSMEYNKIMFKEYGADYVIMKDSGKNGGTLEKLKACEDLGIIPIVIGRKEEEGVHSLKEVEKILRQDHRRKR